MSAGSIPKTRGVGQAYFSAHRDNNGHAFDGGRTYRLHVPPNAPAKQFWSVTLYDIETRILIQNKEQIVDRSSRQDPVKNADDSVDLYFSPLAPKDLRGTGSPPYRTELGSLISASMVLQAYLDRTWPLPDIQKVQ